MASNQATNECKIQDTDYIMDHLKGMLSDSMVVV